MPIEKVRNMNNQTVERIKKIAIGPKKLNTDQQLSYYIQKLSKEIQLDYKRAMNKITFDKVVKANPKWFHYVKLEDPVEEVIPESGTNNI